MSLVDTSSFDNEEEDVHICGLCRAQFKAVESFIEHKKNSCPVRLARLQQSQNKDTGDGDVSKKLVSCVVPCQSVIYEQAQPLSNISYVTEGDEIAVYDESLSCISVQSLSQAGSSAHRDGIKTGTSIQYTVPQTEFVEIENDGGTNSLTHEYVIQSGTQSQAMPISSAEYQHQTSLVYKFTPQTVQTMENLVTNQAIPVQTPASNPQDIGGKVLQLQASSLQLLSGSSPEKEGLVNGQQTVRQLLSAQEAEKYVPGSATIATHDMYVEKELQSTHQQLEYTFSVGPQSVATNEDFSGQARKINTYDTSEYSENIQYTLTSAVQNELPVQVTKETATGSRSTEKGDDSSSVRTEKSSPVKKGVAEKKKAPLDKKFQCSNCSYKTAYLKDLERHHRIHTGEKPFKCEKCDKAFNRNDKLVLHLRYHMNERTFKCSLCDYSAVENGSLKKHMKCHLDERPYSCQVCPYKSRSSSQLQIHLRTHTGDTPYKCTFCDSFFKVSSDLRRHLRTHTGEKPFVCEFEGCSYRCAVKSNMKSHCKSNHSDRVEFQCEKCDFKSCSKKVFHEHKKIHNVNLDLTCTTCGYQCSNKSALKNHVRMHNAKDKFSCNHCSYQSVQSGNVQAHMRRRHPQKSERRMRKSKLEPAPVKKKDSDDNAELSKRGNVKTKCQQNFNCDQCSAAFVREDSLKCHMRQHKDKCSSLSTAYAVLKLQQPVINPQPVASTSSVTTVTNTYLSSADVSITSPPLPSVAFQGQGHSMFQGQVSSVQGQTSQGINDILLAAGMTGSSPTLRQPDTPLSFQNLQSGSVGNGTSKLVIPASNSTVQNITQNVVISSTSQDKQVPVMQNISLPYMRLPNGQVLILTGQSPAGQIVTSQSAEPVQHIADDTVTLNANPLTTQQFFPQTVFSDPQSAVQSATMEGASVSLEPQISDGQPAGAIPIQIILPNDSQQPFPFVSQLINSVVNRDSFVQGQAAPGVQQTEKYSFNDGNVQNFVVHIPTQTGLSKDTTGSLPESQSFVLQIPGASALN